MPRSCSVSTSDSQRPQSRLRVRPGLGLLSFHANIAGCGHLQALSSLPWKVPSHQTHSTGGPSEPFRHLQLEQQTPPPPEPLSRPLSWPSSTPDSLPPRDTFREEPCFQHPSLQTDSRDQAEQRVLRLPSRWKGPRDSGPETLQTMLKTNALLQPHSSIRKTSPIFANAALLKAFSCLYCTPLQVFWNWVQRPQNY